MFEIIIIQIADGKKLGENSKLSLLSDIVISCLFFFLHADMALYPKEPALAPTWNPSVSPA